MTMTRHSHNLNCWFRAEVKHYCSLRKSIIYNANIFHSGEIRLLNLACYLNLDKLKIFSNFPEHQQEYITHFMLDKNSKFFCFALTIQPASSKEFYNDISFVCPFFHNDTSKTRICWGITVHYLVRKRFVALIWGYWRGKCCIGRCVI